MAKRVPLTPAELTEASRIQSATGVTRKAAIRKMRAAAKSKPRVRKVKEVLSGLAAPAIAVAPDFKSRAAKTINIRR